MPDSLFPTGQFLALFAQLGEADRAQDLLSEIRERIAESDDRGDPWAGNILEGRIALARGDAEDAGRLFREFRDSDPYCKLATCLLVEIGMAFDRAGSKDSAVVYFERYLTEPDWGRLYSDAEDKPTVLRRLGELYEEIGDFDRAVEYYVSFVELWENADPELQPLVEDARARIARLVGEPRG